MLKKLIHGFIKLDVAFININQANAELLEGVYSNWLYEINFENLSLMLYTFIQLMRKVIFTIGIIL